MAPVQETKDVARREAERRVASAARTRSWELDLSIASLETIPSLNEVPELRTLDLSASRISDLGPAACLSRLQKLDISDTLVSDLRPLVGLSQLKTLNLWGTRVTDLSPLSTLSALRTLELQRLHLSSLAPLSTLRSLEKLSLRYSTVPDLSPLANLGSLWSLDLHGAHVSDFTPLSSLRGLKGLDLSHTTINELSAIADLVRLTHLNISNTPVNDLAPLARLKALERLDISDTMVSSLAPLSGLTTLRNGVSASSKDDGLIFTNCPLTEEPLQVFAQMDEPDRTLRTLDYLQRHAPPPEGAPPGARLRKQAEKKHAEPFPKLPSQGPGPQFVVGSDGLIDLAPVPPLDKKSNRIERLRTLQAASRQTVSKIASNIEGRKANQYPRLLTATERYREQIDRNLEQIDFAVLYALGLQMEGADAATRRDIASEASPPMDSEDIELLKEFSQRHHDLMLASSTSRDLMLDVERSPLSKEDAEEVRTTATAFGKELQEQSFIAAMPAHLVTDSAIAIENVRDPTHGAGVALKMIANVAVVCSELAIASLILGGSAVGAIAVAWSALRYSPGARDTMRAIEGLFDAAHTAAVTRLTRDVPTFLLGQESRLRRLAVISPRFRFVNDLFDWLHKQMPNS